MRKIFTLPLAAIVAAGIVACDTDSTLLAPEGPNYELFNEDDRIAQNNINAWVRLSFALPFPDPDAMSTAGTGQLVKKAQLSGVAEAFPGPLKNAGTCENGTWKNRNGGGMGGTLDDPHPHCTYWEEENETPMVDVILEPISASYSQIGGSPEWLLKFSNSPGKDNDAVKIQTNEDPTNLVGMGIILAWAIRADTKDRVGLIRIDLGQFDGAENTSIDCVVDGDDVNSSCLRHVVTFDYITEIPGDPDFVALGTPGRHTGGFLWWQSANQEYYRDN